MIQYRSCLSLERVETMLSIELIRRDPEFVRQALASRGEEGSLDEVLELDAQRRQAISQGDELRSRRNQASRAIGQLALPGAGSTGGCCPGNARGGPGD